MTSSAREAIKWLAVVFMTCDHVAKVLLGGYVPVLTEVGRLAFPLFALVMAYNLAQPGADVCKSVRRLLVWALVAQPVHALAFGYWLPLNVLFSFVAAALVIWTINSRRWLLMVLAVLVPPAFVDYDWWGLAFVVLSWLGFVRRDRRLFVLAFAAICVFNGNLWALLALPVFWLCHRDWNVPRTRWAFYGYYVGHLALLAVLSNAMQMIDVLGFVGVLVAGGILAFAAGMAWRVWTVRRDLRRYDEGKREF